MHIGHKMGYSGLGILTIKETMGSRIDQKGKFTLLTSYVTMDEDIRKSFISDGKELLLRTFKEYGFTLSNPGAPL